MTAPHHRPDPAARILDGDGGAVPVVAADGRPDTPAARPPDTGTAGDARGEPLPVEGDGYRVSLEKFEGPLDLLLYLIRKEEVDIYDIPISRITDQYLESIEAMERLDLDLDRAGDFLLMAATLMRIKAEDLEKQTPMTAGVDAPYVSAGAPYVSIAEVGILQLDDLNAEHAVVIQRDIATGTLDLRSLSKKWM